MDWVTALVVMLTLLLAGLASGLPVAMAFMAVNIVGLFFFMGGTDALSLLSGSAYDSLVNFVLLPVPLFILMGELLLRSGLAILTVEAADQWIGKLPGRLSIVAVGGGTAFGAISGSSMASAALFGSVLAPEMDRRGYKPQMSVAAILAAAGLDSLIPPSAIAVLLGALANVSIGRLLMATIVPGLLLAAIYAVYFVGRAMLQPELAPSYVVAGVSIRKKMLTLVRILPLLGLIVVVTGFIFFGIATPSETAALGVVAAIILAVANRRLTLDVWRGSILSTAQTTAMLFLIIVASKAYGQLIALTGSATGFVEFATGLAVSPVVMLIMMQMVIIIMGCFIDQISIMMITIPIFMPIVALLGWDPVWICVLFLIGLQLGAVTPPFGLLLFVMQGVQPNLKTIDLYRAVMPIVALQFLLLAIVMGFPRIALWLPNLMVVR